MNDKSLIAHGTPMSIPHFLNPLAMAGTMRLVWPIRYEPVGPCTTLQLVSTAAAPAEGLWRHPVPDGASSSHLCP